MNHKSVSQEDVHGKQGHPCYCEGCRRYPEGDFSMERYSTSAPSQHPAGGLLDLLFFAWDDCEAASCQGPNGRVQAFDNA